MLRDRHVEVEGETLRFHFRGKRGKEHTVQVSDRRLARIVRQCQEIPGYELFQYVDDQGCRQVVDSEDVNEYLRQASGQEFTAKDFRTWTGTLLAALAFRDAAPTGPPKKELVRAIERVAERLGNTPAICRKSYVHPALIQSYLEGTLAGSLEPSAGSPAGPPPTGLRPEEAAVLAFLEESAASGWEERLRASVRASRRRSAASPKRN